MVFVTNMENDMHSEGAEIPILRDGRKNLHDLHKYRSKEKKKEEEIAHSNSLMIMWLKRTPSLEEKKIERDMLTLEQNIWIITKLPKVT